MLLPTNSTIHENEISGFLSAIFFHLTIPIIEADRLFVTLKTSYLKENLSWYLYNCNYIVFALWLYAFVLGIFFFTMWSTRGDWNYAVPPGTKSGPGASSNMTDLRFCEVQNRRRKCCSLVRKMMWSPKKKRSSPKFQRFFRSKLGYLGEKKKKEVFTEILFTCWFLSVISMGPLQPTEANDLPEAHGPSKVHWPRGHCFPLSAALKLRERFDPEFGTIVPSKSAVCHTHSVFTFSLFWSKLGRRKLKILRVFLARIWKCEFVNCFCFHPLRFHDLIA